MRSADWWEFKLVPIFAVFYASAAVVQTPVSSLWRTAALLLFSMIPGAVYVSLINDVTDREADRAASKVNTLTDVSRAVVAGLLGIVMAAGLAFAWRWRGDTPLLASYLAAWVSFSLYSLPPFRLKGRGLLGVLSDASGASLFPTLVAVILVYRGAGRPVDESWIVPAGVWALAYGVRGILWHQLTDRENDRASGVHTFAEKHPAHLAVRLGTYVAFPLEVLALAAMCWRVGSVWTLACLAAYLDLSRRRIGLWRMNAVIVAPQPRFFIVLQEYYDFFFPVALLVASSIRHPSDLTALVAHVLIFPAPARQTLGDLWKRWAQPANYQR